MADRIYLMPIVGAGTREDPRRPKYRDTDLVGVDYTVMDCGDEAPCLVAASVTAGVHAALVAHADVTAVPADLDQQIGGSLSAVQVALESLNIPSQWVQSSFTYRSVLRVVAALFQFFQRYQALGGPSPFGTGVTLDTHFNQLPQAARTALVATAQDLGYDTSALSGTSTIRQCLKAMADQWRAIDTIYIGDQVF